MADKYQAIHQFWSSFGMSAYDENSVPDGHNKPEFPYITYSVSTDSLGNTLFLNASIWYRSISWEDISKKTEEVAERISKMNPISIDGGYLWIIKGTPFAQRMNDPSDDMIRRVYLNITTEFLTLY